MERRSVSHSGQNAEQNYAFPSLSTAKPELIATPSMRLEDVAKRKASVRISDDIQVHPWNTDIPRSIPVSSRTTSPSISTTLGNSNKGSLHSMPSINPRRMSQSLTKSLSTPNIDAIRDQRKIMQKSSDAIKNAIEQHNMKLSQKKRSKITKALEKFLAHRPNSDDDLVKKALRPADGKIPLDIVKVKLLVDYLLARGVHLEGIFRISASITEQKLFWEEFTKGNYDFSLVLSPHTVAASLKMYFREQPEAVIPPTLYNEFLSIPRNHADDPKRDDILRDLVSKIPSTNRRMLFMLLELFRQIAANFAYTKMGPDNIGIVWGPNLLKPKVESMETIIDTPITCTVVAYLINLADLQLSETDKQDIATEERAAFPPEPALNPMESKPELGSKMTLRSRTKLFIAPVTDISAIQLKKAFQRSLLKKKTLEDDLVEKYFLVHKLSRKKQSIKPTFLVFSTRRVFLFSAVTNALEITLNYSDIKEILVDKSEKGLFALDRGSGSEPITLLSGKKNLLEPILNTFESGRTLAKAFDHSVSSLVITRTALLESERATEEQDSSVMQYSWVLATLSEAGFSGQEVWDGAVNLVEVMKSFQLDREVAKDKYVVQFVFPDLPEFQGVYTKTYRVDNFMSTSKILSFLFEKLNFKNPSRFALAPMKGDIFKDHSNLASCGLGTLFESWQLRLVLKATFEHTSNFAIEFQFPETPEFAGLQKKFLRVDPNDKVCRVLAAVFSRVNMPQPHKFEIVHGDGQVMLDHHALAVYGIGVRHKIYPVKVRARKFPLGNNPQQDTKMVKAFLVDDFFDSIWQHIQNTKRIATHEYCSSLVNFLVDDTLDYIEKGQSLKLRVASLNMVAQTELMKFMVTKEREEKLPFMKGIQALYMSPRNK